MVRSRFRHVSALRRVVVAIVIGLLVGPMLSFFTVWQAAALLGWDATALCFLVWVWLTIWQLTPNQTRQRAVREDRAWPWPTA